MNSFQCELIHEVEYSLSNEQLNDRIHEEISRWIEDLSAVRESNEYLNEKQIRTKIHRDEFVLPNVM